MGKLAKICEKIVNKIRAVCFGVKPRKVKSEEKCSYTLSSVFPSVEIQEEVYKVLTEQNRKEVSE